jgi:peptide/nickel transport system substrate-binding protein
MGVASPAIDTMINAMVNSVSAEDFASATKALDRLLTAGRYVIPIHSFDVGRIAHVKDITYPTENTPLYGDSVYFLPEVWWHKGE